MRSHGGNTQTLINWLKFNPIKLMNGHKNWQLIWKNVPSSTVQLTNYIQSYSDSREIDNIVVRTVYLLNLVDSNIEVMIPDVMMELCSYKASSSIMRHFFFLIQLSSKDPISRCHLIKGIINLNISFTLPSFPVFFPYNAMLRYIEKMIICKP